MYSADYKAREYKVDADVRRAIDKSPWSKFSRSFYTQTIDPMFMEPESGLAWYDPAQTTLHLVLGTQSPTGDLSDCTSIYLGTNSTACPPAPYQANFGLSKIDLVSCYPGGGFGGRDQSYFPMYLAMAAPFAKAPLRWAQNRFEQFQVGLKRCESEFTETLAIDKNGLIQGLLCNYLMNGGGERNLSPFVVQLAALSSMSCYNIPRAVAGGGVSQTRHLLGGSQRGFGGPQAFMAIETLLDEGRGQPENRSVYPAPQEFALQNDRGHHYRCAGFARSATRCDAGQAGVASIVAATPSAAKSHARQGFALWGWVCPIE